jgi:hypothetical protein
LVFKSEKLLFRTFPTHPRFARPESLTPSLIRSRLRPVAASMKPLFRNAFNALFAASTRSDWIKVLSKSRIYGV